uniref:Candidapepsin (Aspartate protease) (Secreted aspartic proteinase) (SAPT)) n=1 Tax=Ganoderma boninense TaxID=34458 RepID=A0A5K1K820_9APHY|nr:Candidapepsin (EC (ACP) (Aspartate protease) (Secreted aspartic proteinase) (SAPT) [Ganoderma boninense]
MPFHTPTTWPWVACAIILSLAIAICGRRKNARLPPGPTPFPILGNVLDFPRKHLGREFAAMSKTFGDVVHLDMLGQNVIVLGSLKAARDLLDKRSANYSDRPSSVMVELVEYDWLTALAPYGPRWRQHRRALHSVMAPDALSQYEAVQVDVARNFLRMVFSDPQGLASHIEFASASAILKVIYGIEIREANDRHYEMVDRMRAVAETISIPGNFPVEAFPVLRYLPSWFPGGGFKMWAADAKRGRIAHLRVPVQEGDGRGGKSQLCLWIFWTWVHTDEDAALQIKNPSRPSAIKRIFQLEGPRTQAEQSSELYRTCKDVAATCFLGGADTGNATVGAFFFAMAAYPEAQKKAQRELDAVVGTARLPDFSDRHRFLTSMRS